MKQILLIATFLFSQAAPAKVIVCKGTVADKIFTLELLNKKQGSLHIENTSGEKVSCDLAVSNFEDLRKGVISMIRVDFVREFQCNPLTKIETDISRKIDFNLYFGGVDSVDGDFHWKQYSPKVKCEVQELDLGSLGLSAFRGSLMKRVPAATKSSKPATPLKKK